MKEIYNNLAKEYHKNRDQFNLNNIFNELLCHLPSNGTVLDLGCGAGDSFPVYFIEKGFLVTGYDFSEEMLKLAKTNNPKLHTICQDLKDIVLNPETFDVVTSIYALFHLPNKEQFSLMEKVYHALKPGGIFFFTYAGKEWTGKEKFEGEINFMGNNFFYAHVTTQEIKQYLETIGFKIKKMDKKTINNETFWWITTEK